MAESTTLNITTQTGKEAQIVLDWDDDVFYISSITSATDSSYVSPSASAVADSTSSVKVAVWNKEYKYSKNDIIADDGILYTSMQNQNKGNKPNDGTFWWQPVVDLSHVDAVTLEGKNLTEITRTILGGNVISDYYKATETKALILNYINNINAKQLGGWSLEDIKTDYSSSSDLAKLQAKTDAIDYFTSEASDSYQMELVDLFNNTILPDDVNQG